MIKNIIKRDGRIEPYQPKKLYGWGQWAAKSLGKRVDWSSVIIATVSTAPETISAQELQNNLIKTCLDKQTYSYFRMAGRLYASVLHKEIHGDEIPLIRVVHHKLSEAGLMVKLDYTAKEYTEIEAMVDHSRDFDCSHFSLHQIRKKYSLQNRKNKIEYETAQFVYIRMAMTLAMDEPQDKRLAAVKKNYDILSLKALSAPSPNYINLGTELKGYASCCLFKSGDTIPSLAAGDLIAYTMTANSAGIGGNIVTRSGGDPVRGGAIIHNGKLPYYASMGKGIKANVQAGRSGALTIYYEASDPEANTISLLRNPRSTEKNRNRDMHYSMLVNSFMTEKAKNNEQMFSFNCYTAPDLHKALYGNDIEEFKRLYYQYEQDPKFVKNMFHPRDLIRRNLTEAVETGVAYVANIDEINYHTPFKEPIHSSNLCAEIAEPTEAYESPEDLYSTTDVGYVKTLLSNGSACTYLHEFTYSECLYRDGKTIFAGELKAGDWFTFAKSQQPEQVIEILEVKKEPEVAMCSLAAIPVDTIETVNINDPKNIDISLIDTDAQYEEVMYLAFKMIDYCILNSDYPLPHIGFTAKKRMSAGVGIMGLATHMARKKLKYSSPEGMIELHRVYERHMYFAIRASLRIAKERGNAPWIHKTKWAEGWLPIDTYNKNVDTLGDFKNIYDWETLRGEIKEQGGIGHSCLVAYMPGESSSKALGGANGIYKIREKVLVKTDNGNTLIWAAPYGDDPEYEYEIAWDSDPIDTIREYAVCQKWTDQAISADWWLRIFEDARISSTTMLKWHFEMVRLGNKTRYYLNTNTSANLAVNGGGSINDDTDDMDCENCTM